MKQNNLSEFVELVSKRGETDQKRYARFIGLGLTPTPEHIRDHIKFLYAGPILMHSFNKTYLEFLQEFWSRLPIDKLENDFTVFLNEKGRLNRERRTANINSIESIISRMEELFSYDRIQEREFIPSSLWGEYGVWHENVKWCDVPLPWSCNNGAESYWAVSKCLRILLNPHETIRNRVFGHRSSQQRKLIPDNWGRLIISLVEFHTGWRSRFIDEHF